MGDAFTVPATRGANADSNPWQVLRYDTSIANRELILKGVGYSGEEEIYVGFRCYQSKSADYYNLTAAAFTGYVASNSFATQPGVMMSGVPAHNQRIDYWLSVNPQRIALAMKVGTPVYESCYVGKFLPYARPDQYPYPVVCGGMLSGEPETRFSDTSHSIPYKGNRTNMGMRFNDGTWKNPESYPWNNSYLPQQRDTNDSYTLNRVELNDSGPNIYGYLDGIFHIAGFNNVVENTLEIDGIQYIVIQDTYRTGAYDYYALRMDA